MRPDDSLDAFQRCLGVPPAEITGVSPGQGVEAMLRFFRETRAEGCNEPEGDALLFQWGTLDWGRGEQFELNITRQFRPGPAEDDAIAQLSLTFLFSPDAELRALGQDAQWCREARALAEFERVVLSSAPYRSAASRRVTGVELKYEYV